MLLKNSLIFVRLTKSCMGLNHLKTRRIYASFVYRIVQPFLFLLLGLYRAARIASSKTDLRPSCVKAEHSRYLTAFTSETILVIDSLATMVRFFCRSCACVSESFRRSAFVPTSMIGTPGA